MGDVESLVLTNVEEHGPVESLVVRLVNHKYSANQHQNLASLQQLGPVVEVLPHEEGVEVEKENSKMTLSVSEGN